MNKEKTSLSTTDAALIDSTMQSSKAAFDLYSKLSPAEHAAFLEQIALELEKNQPLLVQTAKAESNLPEPRLNGEVGRTTGQLRMFANLLKEGSWVEATIDTANPQRAIPKPDIRKMLVPSGPVVVFGASNFPFAFSTAGGDTASALAAGCTVVIKGHPAHAKTSQLVFEAMQKAIEITGVPAATVQHLAIPGNDTGRLLVQHPHTRGVGFTGSFTGGMALVEYASKREVPIPVFAEMSSVNPVVFYPAGLEKNYEAYAVNYAGSICLGVGQFCTNPGLLFALKSASLNLFKQKLAEEISKVSPATMLHSGIAAHYAEKTAVVFANDQVQVLARSNAEAAEGQAGAVLASVAAKDLIANPALGEEIFGPYSLVVECNDKEELKEALRSLKGQITTTLMAEESDLENHADLVAVQSALAGRIIYNNVPTGVEVCASMVHGGPFPATTDARFTSVGTGAIKRWVRPVAFQNFPQSALPVALKNTNTLGIMRIVDNNYTREDVQ